MIVYNVTIKILPAIEIEWLKWQLQAHIPEMIATGCFTHHRFYKLLEQEDDDGVTYIVQYFAANLQDYEQYLAHFAALQRQKSFDRWGNQFIAFRTIMQELQ